MFSALKHAWRVIDDRLGVSKFLSPILKHKVPPGAKWKYVFGSATLFAFVLQIVTGIVLSTTYVPSTNGAYDSLKFITDQAIFGHVVRGLHYFGASAMILMIGLHTIRVFLMAAYKFPREANWLTGSVLMLFTLGMAFTGQLLRWDQTALWSVVVGAEQAARVPFIGVHIAHVVMAGNTIGGATLSRFFALHVFFLPAGLFAFIGAHLYLVLHNGISDPPKAGQPVDPHTYRKYYEQLVEREGVPFWPDAAWRDVTFAFLMTCVVFVLAWIIGPPALSKPPDPTILQAYPRPDWYFLWYFAVLALTPSKLEPFVIVLGPLIFGLILFALPFISNRGERAPTRRPWAMATVLLTCMVIATFWYEGAKAPWSPDFTAKPLTAKVVDSSDSQVQHGALLFHQKGCEYCHYISGSGGHRGPDLTDVANRLTPEQITIRLLNGGHNMPAFAGSLSAIEVNDLVAFLRTRTTPDRAHLSEGSVVKSQADK